MLPPVSAPAPSQGILVRSIQEFGLQMAHLCSRLQMMGLPSVGMLPQVSAPAPSQGILVRSIQEFGLRMAHLCSRLQMMGLPSFGMLPQVSALAPFQGMVVGSFQPFGQTTGDEDLLVNLILLACTSVTYQSIGN